MIELLLTLSVLTGQTSSAAAPASSATQQQTQQDQEVRRSARQYRIEVYRTFRDNRAEFDRRREAGGEVLKAWFTAGRNPADSQAVVRWFEESLERMQSETMLPLPAPPTLAGATSQPATFPRFGDQTMPPTVDPAAAGTADIQPLRPFEGFDAVDDFDAPAPSDDYTDSPIFSTTTTDRTSASPSSSALDSLRRALMKAAIDASQQNETEEQFDALPDWPSRDTR